MLVFARIHTRNLPVSVLGSSSSSGSRRHEYLGATILFSNGTMNDAKLTAQSFVIILFNTHDKFLTYVPVFLRYRMDPLFENLMVAEYPHL